jgi:CBS domain-containing protein
MLCEQIMNRSVKALHEEDSAQSAARLMRDANVGFVPVCGSDGRVVGTVTDRDIVVRLAADSGSMTTPVCKLMTRNVVCCKAGDDLRRCEQLMFNHRKSRVVCVDEQGHPVGVISLSDVARHENGSQMAGLLRSITTRETATRDLRGS